MNAPDSRAASSRFPEGAILLLRTSPWPSLLQPLFPHLGASAGENGRLDSAGWAAHPGHSPETVERGSWVSDRSHPDCLCPGLSTGALLDPLQHESTLQTLAEHLGCMGHSVCHVSGSRAAGGSGKGVRHCPCLAVCISTLQCGQLADVFSASCDSGHCGTCHNKSCQFTKYSPCVQH